MKYYFMEHNEHAFMTNQPSYNLSIYSVDALFLVKFIFNSVLRNS